MLPTGWSTWAGEASVVSSTKPPSGTRDFLPEEIRRREYVTRVVRDVYERYGFEPLETPAFENIETLLGKYGEEGNKLIFKILRRGEHEASGEADLALRYDLTVPLARVVAQHQNDLPRLFKRYQIQPVWRADRRRADDFVSSSSATSTRWAPLRPLSRSNCFRRYPTS
ncbi:MAG: hypothetical protein DMF89_16745 [Acidobacteria bacterium]|nr:MAG: hypothetical protein DMF89_16745 [Acidobacteriota bacterium]